MRRWALFLVCVSGCFSDPPGSSEQIQGSSGSPVDSSGEAPDDTTTGGAGESSESLESSTSGWVEGSTSWVEGSSGFVTDGGSSSGSETGDPPLQECGDGVVQAPEACDDPDAVLEAGACRPDCTGVIETRVVRLSNGSTQGDLGDDPVATVDAMCPGGYLAMFADGVTRRAANSANAPAPMNWVLAPYTAYVDPNGTLLWVTDEVPLLGVRSGTAQMLDNPIVPFEANPPGCLTGMGDDWTTLVANHCEGWSSSTAGAVSHVGIPWIDGGGAFLNNGGVTNCDVFSHVYCVQQ